MDVVTNPQVQVIQYTKLLTSIKLPHFIEKLELDDLVSSLNLCRKYSEILDLNLQDWNLLLKIMELLSYRKRNGPFEKFFYDVNSLMTALERNIT